VDVLGLATNRGSSVELAAGLDKIEGIEKMTALVTLISARIVVVTPGAFTLDVTICQERAVLLTVRLLGRPLNQEAVIPEALEDGLRDLSVLLSGSAAEVVEANVEPLVYFLMDLIVLGAKLLRRHLLLQRLGFGCCTVFVRSTNVESGPSTGFVVSNICALACCPLCGVLSHTWQRHRHLAQSRRRCPGEEHYSRRAMR